MFVQKGFISNTTFANNTPGVVAQLGELSSNSMTFSREKGLYSDNVAAKNLTLTTFTSKDGVTPIAVPPLLVAQILEIANTIYASTLGGQITIDPTLMLENLLTTYEGRAEDFRSGNIISDGVHALPEWLSWKSDADPAYADNFVKIWFIDQSFQQQYDEYEIIVVPPFDLLNKFFLSGTQVELFLTSVTSSEKMDRLQAAKEGYPETVARINTYTYIDPVNVNHVVPSDWGVLIYGAAGDNVDSIKDALMAYILANSTYLRPDWTNILPDIFKRTEFILLPLWDQYAIPNRQIETGIYSQQIHMATAVAKMKQYATQYPGAHIDLHVMAMGHPYRSLGILSIGSPDNRNSQFELSDVFPDLISVTSTSVDFSRMNLVTQEWASLLATMLVEAEKMSAFTTIPTGMMKVTRDGILYLTKSYKNINYLVVAKSNFTANGDGGGV